MGHVLHNWDLDRRKLVLAKAYALPAGGRLVVYEAQIDDERRRDAAGLLGSLNLLIETAGGSNFTAAECRTGCTRRASGTPTEALGRPRVDGERDEVITAKRPSFARD